MCEFTSVKVRRFLSLLLVMALICGLTGCNIRKSHVEKKKVLVDKTEDSTVWVEEEGTEKTYTKDSIIYQPSQDKNDKDKDNSSSGKEEDKKDEGPTQEEIESKYTQKQSQYIRNVRLQKPRYLFEEFCIDSGITTWSTGTYDNELVKKCIEYYKLPNSDNVFWPASHGHCYEWGYTFFLNTEDGGGNMIGQGGFNPVPTTRKAAIAQLKKWMISAYKLQNVLDFGWEAGNGHYPWQHYAAEFGANCVGSETGESISSTQSRIAFSRGAARQYQIPFFIDFSYWYSGVVRSYSDTGRWNYTPEGGHSDNLYERTFMASFMGGASHFYNEDMATLNLIKNSKTADGYYKLSPVGEVSQRIFAFSNENKDVGINYIPFGIVLDREHGMYSGDSRITAKKAFNVWDYTQADQMSVDLLQLFFPGSNNVIDGEESNFMVNGPYGDTCDVLLQNASQDILNSYPCLILSGDLNDLSASEKKHYTTYVKQGGTLILNTAYLSLFPDYKMQYNGSSRQNISDEKGTVIIYGGDYSLSGLDSILREQIQKFIPFTVSGDIEYMINVKNGSLIVTLINNKGYYKPNQKLPYTDVNQTKGVEVTYNGNLPVKQVKELWQKNKVDFNSNKITCQIEPGGIRVYEFVID